MHLQTQQKGKIGLVKMGIKVLKSDGIFGLYNGLTASLLRQVTQHNESSDCVTEAAVMCASRCTLSVKVCCICWLLIHFAYHCCYCGTEMVQVTPLKRTLASSP